MTETYTRTTTQKMAVAGAIAALAISIICVIVALFAVGTAIDIWFQYQWAPLFAAGFFAAVGAGGIAVCVVILKKYG